MPRQRMTWEQVDRSIHRIRGLFPRGSRIVEFGISPLTKKISDTYDLQVIERGKVARRWDIDPNILISTPVNESEKGVWFWFPDEDRLPKQVELIILHDVEGDIHPYAFLSHEYLKDMATDFLVISNKNDKSENLVEQMEKELNGDKKLLINEPDMSIWHITKSPQKEKNSQSTVRADLITRLYYAAGFRKLAGKRIKKLVQMMPDDIRYKELAARIEATPGSWESASHMYEEIHSIDPDYRDVAWQTVRSSIYAARWNIVGRIMSSHTELWENNKIQNMIEKKFQLIGEDATNRAIEQIISHRYNPNWLIKRWVHTEFNRNQDLDSPVAKIALSRFHGPHIGHEVMQRINLGELEAANDIILNCTNKYGVIATLESICIDENLPVLVNDSIREILADCDSETIHQAIQAIGRRGDPSQFLAKSSIMMMIENGTTLYSWMIEFGLRSGDKSLLNSLFEKKLPGTAKAIIDSLENLVANRRDERITTLIEAITENRALYMNQELRRIICKSLLVVADPIITHSFAMESIRLEPQDAVCGFIALEAAIATAEPEIILSTADIVLCMRSRSSHIDYASIAIAAIRMNQIDYAKDLLTRNRLKMDLRAQRIRVGIPFHEDRNWDETLFQVERTPAKFRDDTTIKIYEANALSSMMRHESAEEVANSINDFTEKSILLYSLRQSWGDFEGALESWNNALVECNLSKMPLDWGDSGFDYYALQSPPPATNNYSQKLVSVIMTIHKWNDAFPLAVSSILNQSHAHLELIIIDDCSSEEDVKLYDSILKDERIIRIRMDENVGTYACRNKGLDIARGEFVTFADSDDWNHPERIRVSIQRMDELGLDLSLGRYVRINEAGVVQFNGGRLSRFALMGMMIRRSVLIEHKFRFDGRARTSADSELFERLRILLGPDRTLRHSGIEIVALHHSDSLTGGGEQAIDWTGPGKKRLAYVAGYSNFHRKIIRNEYRETNILEFQPPSDSILGEYPNERQKRIRRALNIQQKERSKVNSQTSIDENESIYAFMATYPGGFNTVGDAIRSLLSQSVNLTKIILHVNGTSRPPKLPKDSRLKVILSEENLADNGKFQHMNKLYGYLFTVDDDIEYPPDYIEKLILEIERYNRKAIVGVHGACLPFGPNLTRWSQYKELRRSHLFQQEHASRIQVDILGTGTTAFHSSINPPEAKNMATIRMVDLHLATWALSQQIPMYLVPRRRNWLTEFENIGDERIWSMTQEDRDLQQNMLSVIRQKSHWNRMSESLLTINNGPLSVARNWHHRELPPGLSLPPLQSWPDLSDNPLVTIYIPAYNAENFIEECINSALNQTYNRIEVCIHNDGSTDKTLKLLQRKFGNIDNVTISSATNQGIGGASNQAIQMGKGELILQLDSDDFIEPNTVEILVDAIGRNNVCAYGRFRRITHEGDFIDDGWEEPTFSRARLLRSMIVHPPRLFRRDAWEFVGGHNEEITNAVDYDFYTRLSEVGTMAHVSDILYSYRMQELSTSHTKNEIQTTNTYGVVRRSLGRQGLNDYDIHIPNPKYPRRFSIIDRRFT